MKTKVFITGGTIDGVELGQERPKVSSVPGLLEKIKTEAEISYEVLMLKDSREVGDKERELIYQKCRDCEEDKIVITHGSITMADTGKFLLNKKMDKTIVLTGAMIPANQPNSDALACLTFAVQVVESKPNGVYVAMNDQVFDADNVRKNVEKGVFEQIK